MTGSRRRTGDDRGSWHPPVAPWLRILGAVAGVLIVALTVVTVAVQASQAGRDREQADYARLLTEWEDCRIDAITRSSVTDEFIASVLEANRRIETSPTYEAAKVPRRALDDRLQRLQQSRQEALAEQAACGTKPGRPR